MNSYTSNNAIRLAVIVTASAGGQPIDPTSIRLDMEDPSGAITDLSSTIVKDSVGNYHADYTPLLVGVYLYSWIGTGAAIFATNGKFNVTQAPV